MKSVGLVTSYFPKGHYSEYLALSLSDKVDLKVIADINKGIDHDFENVNVYQVWKKGLFSYFQIIRFIYKNKFDIIHVQHEINMYGGAITALLFPAFLLACKIFCKRIITTIHAAPEMDEINSDFMFAFRKPNNKLYIIITKLIFKYIFYFIGLFSDYVITHTKLTKTALKNNYSVPEFKLVVIEPQIPNKGEVSLNIGAYILYLGYMVRRKGLTYFLEGLKKYVDKNGNGVKVVFAGGVISGQESSREEILSDIKNLGLNDVVDVLGFVPDSELSKLYRDAKFVILPAKLSIGASGPLYHALSYKKCVVASKVGHLVEEICDGYTGYLVDNSKWDQIIEELYSDQSLIEKVMCNVEKLCITRSPTTTALKHVDVYLGLL